MRDPPGPRMTLCNADGDCGIEDGGHDARALLVSLPYLVAKAMIFGRSPTLVRRDRRGRLGIDSAEVVYRAVRIAPRCVTAFTRARARKGCNTRRTRQLSQFQRVLPTGVESGSVIMKKFTFVVALAVAMCGCTVVASAIDNAYRSPSHWSACSTASAL